MSEEEIIETFKHWIEYEKANKDKIDKADELIEIQQGLLDLYKKEKEKNKENIECIEEWINGERVSINCIHKNKIKEKIKELEMEFKKPYNDYEKLSFAIDILEEILEGEI